MIAGIVEEYFDIGQQMADEYVQIPYCSDKNYIDKIISICNKLNVDMIIPAFSDEIEILTKNISKFDTKGIVILSPSYDIVHLLHNKDLMCMRLEKLKINTVP
ncbi:hypothetical protein [Clostridium botulinum]|uniref:hypothetical protein n=1 Tax=Clostridium botulinum TaxID=1491 RepID=UPI0002074F8A|nr:hypothetical protein [Clostridium botulinum]AEB75791.1 hypothetical protein CbC4_1111 [Clostridium botulinum BKT015925]KEH98583.1 hypothetical protein Z953_12890 [Clostridium botulinum D str. 16868]KEI05753.1 hypothetical protein Y848_03455 [Clostridium botulinum C/D str. Sp77]